MYKWIEIKDKLPQSGINENGEDIGCLVWDKIKVECGFQMGISNREYVRTHPDEYTHWMPLPKEPNNV